MPRRLEDFVASMVAESKLLRNAFTRDALLMPRIEVSAGGTGQRSQPAATKDALTKYREEVSVVGMVAGSLACMRDATVLPEEKKESVSGMGPI